MALRDTWRRSLEYFGLVEGDYIEEGEYDEEDTGSELTLDPETAAAPARERGAVRSLPPRGGGAEAPTRAVGGGEGDPRPAARRRAPPGPGPGADAEGQRRLDVLDAR